MRPLSLSPAELGERAAKQEYESYMRQTNFKTIQETKDEIKKVATRCEVELEDLLKTVKAIATGKDPRWEIDLQDKYGITFDGHADILRNSLGLLWEYRNDIATLQLRGQSDPDRKNHEFLSENLDDER